MGKGSPRPAAPEAFARQPRGLAFRSAAPLGAPSPQQRFRFQAGGCPAQQGGRERLPAADWTWALASRCFQSPGDGGVEVISLLLPRPGQGSSHLHLGPGPAQSLMDKEAR